MDNSINENNKSSPGSLTMEMVLTPIRFLNADNPDIAAIRVGKDFLWSALRLCLSFHTNHAFKGIW